MLSVSVSKSNVLFRNRSAPVSYHRNQLFAACRSETPDMHAFREALKAEDVESCNSSGCTVLHMAAGRMHLDLCEALIQHGADVRAISCDNCTPLLHVVRAALRKVAPPPNCREVMELLVQNGANIDTCDCGVSPLGLAAKQGNAELCRLLLDVGADPTCTFGEMTTPLHVAATHNQFKACQVLLEGGAEVGMIDDRGNSPLHLACLHGDLRLVKLLFSLQEDQCMQCLDFQNEIGATPAHCAFRQGAHDIIKFLKKKGADLDIEDEDGDTVRAQLQERCEDE